MAYKANIPQATDLISVSQADLLENFTQLAGMVNPVTGVFGALKMEAGVAPATLATQIALYCKNNGAGTPSLFYRGINNGTEQDLSTLTINPHPLPPLAPDWRTQYSFNLPNGLIVKFARCDAFTIGTANAVVVLDAPFPTKNLFTLATISSVVDPINVLNDVKSCIVTAFPSNVNNVTLRRQASTVAIYVWWLAIGN